MTLDRLSGWTELTAADRTGHAAHRPPPRGCTLEHAGLVDGKHRVLVFRADYQRIFSPVSLTRLPATLVKYVDRAEHAPCTARTLKLATLEHYRTRYPDLEGVGDSMEGRVRVSERLSEMLARAGVAGSPWGAEHVHTTATYSVDGRRLIYCTAASGARPEQHWTTACPIRSASDLACALGLECARQGHRVWCPAAGGIDDLAREAPENSPLASVVRVNHGPVVYSDEPERRLWRDIRSEDQGLAVHFLKRRAFAYQREYRFVVSRLGYRPADEEVFVENTAALRGAFAACVPV